MIPPEAIKPVISKSGRDNTQIAVGSLIAYRVVSQTQEGIQKAKDIIAANDNWLVPSLLPEYYNDIDSDLIVGRDTPAIISIRNSLKEFYGLTTPSSGTQDFVDTREVLPQALVTKKVNHPKLRSHLRRASNYQNRNQRYFLNFESDIDKAIYHTKKVSGSPTTAFKEGIRQWLFAITGLNYDNDDDRNKINNYRQIILNYINTGLKKNSIKKTISESKTTENNNITLFVPTIYDGPFTHVDKTEDQIKDEHNKEVEEVKKLFNKNINHPKLYKDIGIINTLYPVGGRFERINFRSDIDKAIYFSIKGGKSDSEKKQQVREWLFQVTGLQISDPDLTKYREKIIDVIRIVLKYELDENYREDFYVSEIPIVYDGYFQDPDNEEDEEDEEDNDEEYDDEEDTEEYDDLYGSNLDDLLNEIKEDEKEDRPLFDLQFYQDEHNKEVEEAKKLLSKDQDQKQVIENIEEEIAQASDEEDDEEGHIGSEDDIPDELLQDEVDPKLLEKLLVTINKPKKESSYTSNKKIFDSMVVNFGRLQSTLDTINNNLEKQNSLIKANIDTQLAIGELVSNQTELLGEKFDAILKEFEKQSDRAKDIADDEKRKAAEDSLEGQRDAAGTRDIDDLTKGGGKSKRGSKIADYYKQKALRRLYRAMPKRLRGGIRKARKIKQTPSRIAARMTRGITNRMPSSVKRVASGASAIKSASKMTNIPGAKTGPLRTLFAGMEYGERKGQGQSEVQALAGTGGSLAGGTGGAVAGGAVGAGAGALIGGAIGFLFAGVGAAPGALIGAKIGKVAGSLAGGFFGAGKGAEVADSITGADKITGQYETGGLIGPGYSQSNKQTPFDMSPMSSVAGLMIGATTGFLNGAGAVAAPVAPVLKGISAQMARQYDVPSTLTQTNVGGSLPNLSGELKKVKEKGKQTTGEELSGIEKDLLETQDPQSFADKLMKMLDPEGKFQQLLQQINNPTVPPGREMDLNLIGDGAFDTGLRTGPSGVIGGSADYHQDLSFGSSVSMEDKRKLILQMAVAYDRVGRRMMLSNEGVHGNVFPVNGTKEEQIKWIADAEAAHRARNGGTGRNAIDFYAPSKKEDMFGKSVENAPMLAPVIEGAETRYSSGGEAGAGMSMVKDGVKILELIHGRNDIALPKGGRIPSTIAKPTTQPPSPQQTISGKIIRSFKVGNFVYTEREGEVYTQNGKPISKELFDAVVKNHSSVAQASVSPPQQSQQNLVSSISAPSQRQRTVEKTMEIASLSYDNTEQFNGMMIINNQQPSMPPMPAGSPAIPYSNAGRSSSELIKDLMLQRLNA